MSDAYKGAQHLAYNNSRNADALGDYNPNLTLAEIQLRKRSGQYLSPEDEERIAKAERSDARHAAFVAAAERTSQGLNAKAPPPRKVQPVGEVATAGRRRKSRGRGRKSRRRQTRRKTSRRKQ
jgi:hypothetical protein